MDIIITSQSNKSTQCLININSLVFFKTKMSRLAAANRCKSLSFLYILFIVTFDKGGGTHMFLPVFVCLPACQALSVCLSV